MNQQEVIQHAWALTEAIEVAVKEENWPRAAELTEARAPILMSIEADQPPESLATIRRIQASIESIMGRAEAARAMLSTAYRRSMDQARNAGRYQQAARF